jgi:hypothetical protein
MRLTITFAEGGAGSTGTGAGEGIRGVVSEAREGVEGKMELGVIVGTEEPSERVDEEEAGSEASS